MLKGLIAFSFCAQLTWACVPVRPGEDMPCPSFPHAPSVVPGYDTTKVKERKEGGGTVGYCDAPEKLIEVNGGTAKEASGAKLTCNANSGIYVGADGQAVGSKTYACGLMTVPCPMFPAYTPTGTITGVKNEAPVPVTMNGDKVWGCTAPYKLYNVPNGVATMAMPLIDGATVICRKQSGKLVLVDSAERDVDAKMDQFTCGALECQTCDLTKLIDKTDAACSGQTDIFCDSKPMMMNDAMGCPMLSCAAAGTDLYVVTNAMASTRVMMPSTVQCDKGTWKYDANTVATNDIGFVCAKDANCKSCDNAVKGLFGGANTDPDVGASTPAKPICTYTCAPNSVLTVNTNQYSQLVCRMDTEKFTTDTENGQPVALPTKYSCVACNCMDMDLNDGSMGLCPKGSLCVPPTPAMGMPMCAANCKAGSTAIYLDKTMMKQTSPDIKCVGGVDWITANKDAMAGVTCEYAPGLGFSTTPPQQPDVTTACKPLAPLPCPATATCDISQLVYTTDGMMETNVICKKGELITNSGNTDPAMAHCNAAGVWEQTPAITMATCNVGAGQGDACLMTLMDPSTAAGNVDYSCELGVCWISCTGGKKWEYPDPNGTGVVKNSQYMKCIQTNPTPAEGGYADPNLIKCVP